MERFGVPRGKRPRVQVSMDDKERAIARIRGGETKAGISRELGVPESTVRGWVKRAEQRMTRDAAVVQQGNSSYPSILAMAMAKPQISITPASATSNGFTPSTVSVPTPKPPQKRTSNGHPVPRPLPTPMPLTTGLQNQMAPVQLPLPLALPVPLPLPMPVPFPVPPHSDDSSDSQLRINAWLHIFNAGVLNFTMITTAALLQARARGVADRLPLWQIITDFVEEAGRNVAANGGRYVLEASPSPTASTSVAATSPRHRQSNSFSAPRLHITAEDDEDESTESDVDP
ncbi:hypothetical protein KR026_007290 [Drosophila bipectinata]|nr:hypothetical protein KR026_007290 [Drosophila bipectinata]